MIDKLDGSKYWDNTKIDKINEIIDFLNNLPQQTPESPKKEKK